MVKLKSNPALMIIDMQNCFCHKDGSFAKLGLSVKPMIEVIPIINKLRLAARKHNIPVIFTRIGFAEDYSDLVKSDQPNVDEIGGLKRGSWDWEVVDELKPDSPDDDGVIFLNKTRNSSFLWTDLEQILKKHGINQLVCTGVGTNVCVECTVRDAAAYGFNPVTVSDATATVSEEEQAATMLNLKWFGGTTTVNEVLEAMAQRT